MADADAGADTSVLADEARHSLEAIKEIAEELFDVEDAVQARHAPRLRAIQADLQQILDSVLAEPDAGSSDLEYTDAGSDAAAGAGAGGDEHDGGWGDEELAEGEKANGEAAGGGEANGAAAAPAPRAPRAPSTIPHAL